MAIDAPEPGWAEQDPAAWEDAARRAVAAAMDAGGLAPGDVKAVGVAYQMHGLVCLDAQQRVLRPSIIWCDSRAVAASAGILGSLDANRGDYQNGWDTDQFPIDLYELTECMLVFLEAGGLQGGGINFDAKTRRNSTDPEDLFVAHVAGMDAFARAAVTAEKILNDSDYKKLRQTRYASFDSGDGAAFESGGLSLPQLAEIGTSLGEPEQLSGKQELFESILNRFI